MNGRIVNVLQYLMHGVTSLIDVKAIAMQFHPTPRPQVTGQDCSEQGSIVPAQPQLPGSFTVVMLDLDGVTSPVKAALENLLEVMQAERHQFCQCPHCQTRRQISTTVETTACTDLTLQQDFAAMMQRLLNQ